MFRVSADNPDQRSRRGLGALELAIGSLAVVVMVCLSIDVGVLILGNSVLDRATRDATRAAAGQGTAAAALVAAQTSLATHDTNSEYISKISLISNGAPDFIYQNWNGTPFGQTVPNTPPSADAGKTAGNPTVTVSCQATVALPISLSMVGQLFSLGPVQNNQIRFTRTYTFPIVRMTLNNQFS